MGARDDGAVYASMVWGTAAHILLSREHFGYRNLLLPLSPRVFVTIDERKLPLHAAPSHYMLPCCMHARY